MTQGRSIFQKGNEKQRQHIRTFQIKLYSVISGRILERAGRCKMSQQSSRGGMGVTGSAYEGAKHTELVELRHFCLGVRSDCSGSSPNSCQK